MATNSKITGMFKMIVVIMIAAVLMASVHGEEADQKFPKGVSVTVDYLPDECDRKSTEGDTLSMEYTGTIDTSSAVGDKGKQFDSSVGRAPFEFPLGGGQVIKGWDVGLVGMCIGEKRTLVLEPDFAYGDRGAGADIPGGATLKFVVELLDIKETPEPPNIFKEIDTDNSADLTEKEISAWFKMKMDREMPDELMENEDKDKDGVVSWEEFSGPKGDKPTKDEL